MRYGGREEKRTVVMLVFLEPIQAPSHKERYIPLAVLVSWDTSFAGDGTGKDGAGRNEISSIAEFSTELISRVTSIHLRPLLSKANVSIGAGNWKRGLVFRALILAFLYFFSSGLPPSR
jgi:hypothetical protein